MYNKIMGFNYGTTSNGIGIHIKTASGLTQSTVLNTVTLYAQLRNGSASSGSSEVTMNLDQWYHLCVTYNKSNIFRFYVNGVLITSKTITRSSLNTSIVGKDIVLNSQTCNLTASQSNSVHLVNLKEYINDVRIYDHALSAKEVEELSKGLILHYKLDHGTQDDLLLYTPFEAVTLTMPSSGTSVQSSNIEFDELEDWMEEGIVGEGATLTIEYDYSFSNVTATATTVFFLFNTTEISPQDRIGYTHASANPTGHHFSEFQITAEQAAFVTNNWPRLRIKMEGANSGASVTISNLQIYLGTCRETAYDCSGYGNHGQINTVQQGSNYVATYYYDSPRYKMSTYISSGNSNFIQTPTLYLPGDQITISFWFKTSNTTPGGDYHVPLASASGQAGQQWLDYSIRIAKNGNLRYNLIIGGTVLDSVLQQTLLVNGSWHMCTVTYNGTKVFGYLDGGDGMEIGNSMTGSLATSTYFVLGRYGTKTSYYSKETYMSDLRIYTTALSADQVKELYNTAAAVDNTGNIYARELVEW